VARAVVPLSADRFGRIVACSTRLRRRRFFGVTSTSSSSLMNSIACSRPILRGGMRRIASSAEDARMFVCFFSLQMFTSRSFSRAFSPMIMPSYTSVLGSTKISPRSWSAAIALAVVLP